MQRDWQKQDDYRFTELLSSALWAWQFLRRNPRYRQDYQWFIKNWRALEADYGRAPHRDFARWKLDARAYAPEDMTQGLCADDKSCASPDSERVLIECAMGAKWGFYKFPNDPDEEFPRVPGQLLWREISTWLPDTDAPAKPHELGVYLDLRLPVKQQLEELKRLVAIRQNTYIKKHGWNRDNLQRYLRIIDADDEELVIARLFDSDIERYTYERQQAFELRDSDYLRLAVAVIK